MPLYDSYERYRTPLTEADKARLAKAALEEKPEVITDPASENIDFSDAQVDPVVLEYMNIAIEQANQQFEGWPAYPEDSSVANRFPGVDPEGKYSVIDMKFAQRMAQVKANLASRDHDTQVYANSLIHYSDVSADMKEVKEQTISLSKLHRSFTRAAKLCHDPDGRSYLQKFSRAVETYPQIMQMDYYLQGLEYASGVRTGPIPSEVKRFYVDYMQTNLLESRVLEAEQASQIPQEISVEFQNLENKFKQTAFSNPRNWNRHAAEVTADELSLVDVSAAIPPYARATANRVLDPLFNAPERVDNEFTLTRGDYIIVDGKTVREKMYEDYVASGQKPEEFENFYCSNVKKMAGEYVAGALMAGKRVETFVPDKYGRIPDEPTQITKKGYEPSAVTPVIMSGWERFWSKYGFYKEKAKAAEEYQCTLDARERVKSRSVQTQLKLSSVVHPQVKDAFFGEWVERHGHLPASVPNGYNVTGSTMTTLAVCAMLADGHSMEDIFNPDKLVQEKQQMGAEIVDRMMDGDQKWIGEKLFHGQRLLVDFLDQATQKVNVLDEKQLFREDNRILFFAAAAAYDANQERKFCEPEYRAAVEHHSPRNAAAVYNEVDNRVNTIRIYFDYAQSSLASRNLLASGMASGDDIHAAMQALINFEATHKAYIDKNAASPETPMSKLFTIESMAPLRGYNLAVMKKGSYQSILHTLEDPNVQKAVGKGMMTGETQNLMRITVSESSEKCDFKMTSPTKLVEKQTPQPKTPQMGRTK